MDDDWISTTEASKLSGYHPVHIRRLIRTKDVKAQKFATIWMVSRRSLLAYLGEQAKRGERRGPKPLTK